VELNLHPYMSSGNAYLEQSYVGELERTEEKIVIANFSTIAWRK
jgi:hypothetical protein